MCSTGSFCGQQVPNVIRCHDNWFIVSSLNTKHLMHFCLNFTFLSILVISLLTGNDLSHSQPTMHHLISSNASRSICLFLAQWRLISSESAVSNMPLSPNVLLSCYFNCMECFTCDVKCDRNYRKNCVINAPNSKSSKTAVLVILLMWSLVLHWTAEPQEALWHSPLHVKLNVSSRLNNTTKACCTPLVAVRYFDQHTCYVSKECMLTS